MRQPRPSPAPDPPGGGVGSHPDGKTRVGAAAARPTTDADVFESAVFVDESCTQATDDQPDGRADGARRGPYGSDYRPRRYPLDANASHVRLGRTSHRGTVEQSYTCSVCNVPFELELHERSHDDESVASQQHDDRAAGLAGRGKLSEETPAASGSEYHAMEIDNNEPEDRDDAGRSKPHSCPVCPRRFRYRGEVAVHARTHTGEKPFTCPHGNCSMRFKSRPELQKHGKTHSGDTDKLFGCGLCERRFRRKDDAVRHERTHSIEKPHCCNSCDRRFQRPSDLVRHERTHTGEKPYSCSYCPKRYTRRSDALTHERAAHAHTNVNSGGAPPKRLKGQTEVAAACGGLEPPDEFPTVSSQTSNAQTAAALLLGLGQVVRLEVSSADASAETSRRNSAESRSRKNSAESRSRKNSAESRSRKNSADSMTRPRHNSAESCSRRNSAESPA